MTWLSRVGQAVSEVFRRVVPDPFVLAVLLTILTAGLALAFGAFPGLPEDASEVAALFAAWRGESGLWQFLAFAMQMVLVLVTGYALAESRPVKAVIRGLVDRPRSTRQAAAMVAFVACVAGVINWGLGLIVGALLARDTGRSLQRRGIRAHYPLLAAAGYTGLLVWHGGLSGSAPLKASTLGELVDTFGEGPIASLGLTEGVPLTATLGSGLNLFVTGGLVLGVPLLFMLLAPARAEDSRPIGLFDVDVDRDPHDAPATGGMGEAPVAVRTVPEWLGDAPPLAWALGAGLAATTVWFVAERGFARLGLNEIIALMFGLGLFCHGSLRSYALAAEDGAKASAGIILQFPLYAGIMGMMIASGLVQQIAHGFIAIGNETTIPVFTFLSAGLVNLFVPSGGGQWGVQGLIALQTAKEAGIEPGRMIMAVAYGDQLTNMLQPFWALPLLGITGVSARDIVGYTAIVMLAAGAWVTLGLLAW